MNNENVVEISAIDLSTVTGGSLLRRVHLTKREEQCLSNDLCFAYQRDTKGAIGTPIVRANQEGRHGAIVGGYRV